jgi:hypothetical protein
MRYVESGKLGKDTMVQYAESCMIPYSSVCIAVQPSCYLPYLPVRAYLQYYQPMSTALAELHRDSQTSDSKVRVISLRFLV